MELNATEKLKTDIEAACPGVPAYVCKDADSAFEEAARAFGRGEAPAAFASFLWKENGECSEGEPSCAGMSVSLLYPFSEGESPSPLAVLAMAAAACAAAIERLTPEKPLILWPGEIAVGGKKTGSVFATPLVDGERRGVIAGAAVRIYPAEPGQSGGVFEGSLNAPYLSPGRLAGETTRGLLYILEHPEDPAYMDFYRDRSPVICRDICYTQKGETCFARAMGVDDDGALVIMRMGGSPERLLSEDVSVRLV